MLDNDLTDRQREIKTRLDKGMQARAIAEDLGITRNAVYQQIQRLRKSGALDPDFTPSGLPAREVTPGAEIITRLLGNARDSTDVDTELIGTLALVQELRRTRDELQIIVRRISAIVP